MYDVFISYRRKQGFAVAKLFSGLLKAKGLSAFVDLEELRSGKFDDKILTAIGSAPSFILVLTPGALDRCGEPGDWLTKEILAAIESGRNIIPVLCDDFKWPQKWSEEIPDEIRMLSKYNCVLMSYEYIDATVDKIIEYAKGEDGALAVDNDKERNPARSDDIEGFFKQYTADLKAVAGVDFAFHAGSAWHQDMDRLDVLAAIADAGIPIRVILNTPEVAMAMGKYMRHKLKTYLPFEEAIALWKRLETMYENVSVRITDVPILRIYYSVAMKDPAKSATRVKFYTHGNPKLNLNYARNFMADEPFYDLFCSEFEFLWEHAKADYEE